MTLDELQQQLAEIENSGNSIFATAANTIQIQVEQAKAGQLSSAELREILEDLQRQLSIIHEMDDLDSKEKLNTILTGLITIASAV